VSWIIKASPVIPALEEAFPDTPRPLEVGDNVRIKRKDRYEYGGTWEGLLKWFNATDPVGVIKSFSGKLHDVEGGNGVHWLVASDEMELI